MTPIAVKQLKRASMKVIKLFLTLLVCGIAQPLFAQEMPAEMSAAIKTDDSAKLASLVTKENVSTCYPEGSWQYSPLSQTIRHNAVKCFNLLIAMGADVNKACDGY